MVRIAILEDEAPVRQTLAGYLRRYTQQYGTEFSVGLFADGDELLEGYRPDWDIILLDVEMPRLDGMTTAEHIRRLDGEVILIFITNMAQYAIRGYAVDAMDYILKPVPYFAFSQQLQKAIRRLEKRARACLTVPVEGGFRRVDLASVYYLESAGHKVRLYTEEEELTVPGSLKQYEVTLADKQFARCNSGYLVNLAQVRGMQDGMVLVGPHRLQISRPRRKAFVEALTDYVGGVAR
ncbi:MAG: LytR/AlgR family response regulator transcription factor [Gemmiger sp.]